MKEETNNSEFKSLDFSTSGTDLNSMFNPTAASPKAVTQASSEVFNPDNLTVKQPGIITISQGQNINQFLSSDARFATINGKTIKLLSFVDARGKHLFESARPKKFSAIPLDNATGFRWTSMENNISLSGRKLEDFPMLYITEYQPYVFAEFLQNMLQTLSQAYSTVNSFSAGLSSYIEASKTAFLRAKDSIASSDVKNLLADFSTSRVDIFSNIKASERQQEMLGIPMREMGAIQIKEQVCEYTVPWFTREDVISVTAEQFGTYNSLKELAGNREILSTIGEQVDTMLKAVNNYLPINLPPMFDWRFDYAQAPKPTVRNSFILYNSTWKDLVDNYRFIHSFASGSQWMVVDDMRYPSNLFRIRVPGRFDYECCVLSISVKFKGSSRLLTPDQVQKLFKDIGMKNEYSPKNGIEDFFVPDMFVVDFTFSSLLPSNFNIFLNMLVNNDWKVHPPYKPLIKYGEGF